MKRIAVRAAVTVAAAAAFAGVAGGVADAAPSHAQEGTPIWLLPGVDVGPLLDPAILAPANLLAPVYGLITLIGG
ncbi:hypothetical protein [Amycolatopsis minnesotensis]|uniref:Uncharacterized protein n=1 Tax=Amycolatopsis minnesotensis TaxID=337894 RepID=A0ABP5BJ45_9PSEU